MTTHFVRGLDAFGAWRESFGQQLNELSCYLAENHLADAPAREGLRQLGQRVASEKLVVAFVAEFSRGKSELINAIFFADTGQRMLPATPGRTTMCPVELGYDANEAAGLELLPIETRLEGLSLAELRSSASAWRVVPLNAQDPQAMSQALMEVTRTQWVTQEKAAALGFWDDERAHINPPRNAAGQVEVPKWRHAVINYPHPLLRQGLVVIDTPGLNALGAEPELTLSLLPAAHATVFILGADTGVTQSDMAIWRDHLSGPTGARYVVLNKIDALADPLMSADAVAAQIESQRQNTARLLDIPADHVFPLSARQALVGRVAGNDAVLQSSRLPEFESALVGQLLPQREQIRRAALDQAARQIEDHVARKIGDARRQLTDQLLELRGLRGKSGAKVRMMLERMRAEASDFEQGVARLQALRAVHGRMMNEALATLSGDRLAAEVARMQADMAASLLNLGTKRAFIGLCARLRSHFSEAQSRNHEVRDMLSGSFSRLNAELGFALVLEAAPDMSGFQEEITLIERNYMQYLGLSQALRLSQPSFVEQFRRMLVSKLRTVFDLASGEIELWNKGASAQLESQLKERRRNLRSRSEALQRIQSAAGELEQRLTEIEAQDHALQMQLAQVRERVLALRQCGSVIEPLAVEMTAPTGMPQPRPSSPALRDAPAVRDIPVLRDAVLAG